MAVNGCEPTDRSKRDMSDPLLEELAWLRPPPRLFFPRSSRPSSVSRLQPTEHKKKETWAYTVLMLLHRNKPGGRIIVKHYSKGEIGRAPFVDRFEGDTLFEEAWEEAQVATQNLERQLS